MILPKFSMGIGDRFGMQGQAQLRAFIRARELGVEIAPIWNKSNREHVIIGTEPQSVRSEADSAVRCQGWSLPYFVDADHIGLQTVDRFLSASDFYTIDVADFTGKRASSDDIRAFVAKHADRTGSLTIGGLDEPLSVSRGAIESAAEKYLLAIQEAAQVYRRIESVKGREAFVTEVSMDETDQPQSPVELLFILAAIADCGIPAQTIAPKFTGRFNKGVDYEGDLDRFEDEFNADLAVAAYAASEFGLPQNLKLSVHSGSDKFSLYGPIRAALKKHNSGLHLKTAGTTWLEELIGLAASGGESLMLAKEIYAGALARFDELCGPYATVLSIDKSRLPAAAEVNSWNETAYVEALRHDQQCTAYNPHFRQLLHVGYKIAAETGERYFEALRRSEATIAEGVEANIFERHLSKIFL